MPIAERLNPFYTVSRKEQMYGNSNYDSSIWTDLTNDIYKQGEKKNANTKFFMTFNNLIIEPNTNLAEMLGLISERVRPMGQSEFYFFDLSVG